MRRWTAQAAIVLFLAATASSAEERAVAMKASFIFDGERVEIRRDNRDALRFVTYFVSASEPCLNACIAPMKAADGVETVDEAQVLAFLETKVGTNIGLALDARASQDRVGGFIPGSVMLPPRVVDPRNLGRDDVLRALGAREFDGVFNYADAKHLLIYDQGPATDDAGLLVRHLIAAGYPPEKIKYYRGGMQVWSVLGFTIEEGLG